MKPLHILIGILLLISSSPLLAVESAEGQRLQVISGEARLTQAKGEGRDGKDAACLEFTGWSPQHTAHAAVVFAENDGFSPAGAIPCKAGSRYLLSFWVKGDGQRVTPWVYGWPSPDADKSQKTLVPIHVFPPLYPTSEWQICFAFAEVPEGIRCIAPAIGAVLDEKKNPKPGRVLLDDVVFVSKEFPEGGMRAVWCEMTKSPDRERGMHEMNSSLTTFKGAGINTAFVWLSSYYIAALDRPELQQIEPRAGWDAFGEFVKAAKAAGIQVHAYFSPWTYKKSLNSIGGFGRAPLTIELDEHPEWAAVGSNGKPDMDVLCFARPEVRRYELQLIERIIERYPDIAGLHMEEPGYHWRSDYCYCDHCTRVCRDLYGVEVKGNPGVHRTTLNNLAVAMDHEFFSQLRKLVLTKRPTLWLSANASGGLNADWHLGRDWPTWGRRGWIDFFVPQIYTDSPIHFESLVSQAQSLLGNCEVVPGIGLSWDGFYPKRLGKDAFQAQLDIARRLKCPGYVIFHEDHAEPAHWEKLQKMSSSVSR